MRRALLLLFAVVFVIGCRDKPSPSPASPPSGGKDAPPSAPSSTAPATDAVRSPSLPARAPAPSPGAGAKGAWKPVNQLGEDRPAEHAETLGELPKQ